ncbi:MAG: sigma-70 family RNA polymerase sigma factor [Planctomycetes bacterium]|nr:sigma-70 family RNA polymerase sigma factor [Planctomycetota bacterium]
MAIAAVNHVDATGRSEPLAAATRRVRRYLRFLGCERSAVDDLVQETMLAAVTSFPAREPPLPWLLTTARNNLFLHLRRVGRRREIVDLDRLHERWIEQARDDGGDAQREALDHCLQLLGAKARQVIELRYRDGLARDVVATRLGLGIEGVKSLLARTRTALGDCIRRRLGNG